MNIAYSKEHPKRKPWTMKEIEAFKKVYPYNTNKAIADVCERSEKAVQLMAIKLGLKKEKNIGCFKKGQRPWNKGISHSPKGSEKGWFKSGQSNIEVGKVFIWNDHGVPVKYIRLPDHSRVKLSRHVWESANGKIPMNPVIRFKDGNQLNCDIDNLYVVSRAENLHLNNVGVNRSRASRYAWMRIKAKRHAIH